MFVNVETWTVDALCRQGDPGLWDAEGPGRGHDVTQAKRWCALCPVKDECLAYIMRREAGLPKETRYGVWAGLTPGERVTLERSQGAVSV